MFKRALRSFVGYTAATLSLALYALAVCAVTSLPALAGWPSSGQVYPQGPTLLIDFTQGFSSPTYLANVTFSRAGNAMQFDANGYLTYAPNNLLTYSNTFSNAAWSNSNFTILTGISDPVGGTAATTLTATTTYSYILQHATSPSGVTNFLNTIWMRRRTGTGNVYFDTPGETDTLLSLTSSWRQFALSGNLSGSGGNLYVVIKVQTSGDAIDVYAPTSSAVTYETTTRAADQVITGASAYYGPRFDYNPNTLAALGLLVEGSATNLGINSNTFSAWTASAVSVPTASAGTSPDGTNNAWLALANAQFYPGSVTTTATAYTWSMFAKAGTGSSVKIGLYSGYNGSTFTLSGAGSVSANDSGFVGAIVALANGWYRITTTVTASAGTNYPTVTVGAGGTVLIYGAQLENAAFATSYIPTGASSVTRAADMAQLTGTALATIAGATGSAIMQTISESGTSPASITKLLSGTNSILYRDTTGKLGTTNGSNILLTATTPTWNAAVRNGVAWDGSGRELAFTGSAVATDANTVSNGGTLTLGASENGWYQQLAVYTQKLPSATLLTKLTVGGGF